MGKLKNLNRFQKRARKAGECRVNAPELEALLEMSRSDDPEERLTAASFLCPCHVRRPEPRVSEALYRMLEDADVRVRRAAWHTFEDGGGGEAPEVQAIAQRVRPTETDNGVLALINMVCGDARQRVERQRFEDRAASLGVARRRGQCDFCGRVDVLVADRLDTEIPSSDGVRAARICAACEKNR